MTTIGDDLKIKVFDFLDDLRENGEVNMMESPTYVMEEFDVDKATARNLVVRWMVTFGKEDADRLRSAARPIGGDK